MFFKAFMLGVDVCKRVVETGRTVMFVRLAHIHVVQSCRVPFLIFTNACASDSYGLIVVLRRREGLVGSACAFTHNKERRAGPGLRS